ncbi:hypothetical protein D187_004110 [Cystobacter fuscus DSM 2262]|uniref:Uncharacterized protein n=1 Tax=Cystobacter fuscus (strain ATCC 25194 / DSM 2262 / NBRC 100088 / M29) TaxID=1242864 RepID=S9QAI8_CYSF2|nr:hypothetical protein D187_004110 [Cystobacter fuscus DSM 2262]
MSDRTARVLGGPTCLELLGREPLLEILIGDPTAGLAHEDGYGRHHHKRFDKMSHGFPPRLDAAFAPFLAVDPLFGSPRCIRP